MDKLQFYRGKDSELDALVVHSPTLGEICDYGEIEFYSMAQLFCAIPTDYMYELDQLGTKYEDLDEYEFFILMLFQTLSDMFDTRILFPNLNPKMMEIDEGETKGEIIRVDTETGLVFDKKLYKKVAAFLREVFGFKYKPRFAANELTRKKMLEYAAQKRFMARQKQPESILLPLISAMINCAEFKYNHREVWDMPFIAFMDSVKRVQAVRTANEMSIGGYFGVKLSDAKEYLNWMRPL